MNIDERRLSFNKLEQLVARDKTTIYRVANDLDLTNSMFSDWKSGRSMPKLEKLLKIANYFHVNVDYFVVKGEQ